MISRATIFLYRLRHTAVAAAAPAMISRGAIYLYRLRHTAVAAAAPAMISRVLRRSTVVAIVIVRNRSCDATAVAVQHCRRSSSQPHVPSLALSETRGTTAATLQRRHRSQPHAPFSSFVRDQRYHGDHRIAPPQQPVSRPFSSFVRD